MSRSAVCWCVCALPACLAVLSEFAAFAVTDKTYDEARLDPPQLKSTLATALFSMETLNLSSDLYAHNLPSAHPR